MEMEMARFIDVLGLQANQVSAFKKTELYKEFVEREMFYQEFNSKEGGLLLLTKPNGGNFFNLPQLEEQFDTEDFIYISVNKEYDLTIGGEWLDNPFDLSIHGVTSFIISKQTTESIDYLKSFYCGDVLENKELQKLFELLINSPEKYGDSEEELTYKLMEKYGLGDEDLESVFNEYSLQNFCKRMILDTDLSKPPFFIATILNSDELLPSLTEIEDFKDGWLLVDQKDKDGNWLDDDDYASRTVLGINNDELFNIVEEEIVLPQGHDSLHGGFEVRVEVDGNIFSTCSECDWYEERS